MFTLVLTVLAFDAVAGGRILAGALGKTIEPALLMDALELLYQMLAAQVDDTVTPPVEPTDPLDRQARYTWELATGLYGELVGAKVPRSLAYTALGKALERIQAIEGDFTAAVDAGGTPIS